MASAAGTRERRTSSSHHAAARPGTDRVRVVKNWTEGRSPSLAGLSPARPRRDRQVREREVATASP